MSKELLECDFITNGVYIGDPCYAVKDDLYDKWGDKYGYEDGVIKVSDDKKVDFIVHGTMYGDGCYDSNSDIVFPVDAGCICVADINSCKPLNEMSVDESECDIVKFDETKKINAVLEYDNGTFKIILSENGVPFHITKIYTGE